MGEKLKRHKEGETSFLMGGEGEPLMLLHGIPGSALAWEAVGSLLAKHYHVIIPDLLGFGQSDRPRDDFYMEGQARAIKQLLDHLGLNGLYLGGHDFGGPVSLTLMRLFPDLKVNGLVLSNTNVFTDTYIPPPLRVASIPFLNTIYFKAMMGHRLGMRMIYLVATREKAEASWEKFERHLTSSGIDLTRRIFQRSLTDLQTNYRAIEAMLPGIVPSALVLWGADDPFFSPSVAERIRWTIPKSTLKIYEHTGHFVPEERPTCVARDIIDCFRNQKLR